MQFKVFKRKVQDKLFGSTKNTAYGFQVQEMADARMGATYFLAKTRMEKETTYFVAKNPSQKEASFPIDLMGAFVMDTTALSDLKSGCQFLLEKTNAGRKVIGAISVIGEKTEVLIQKIKQLIAGFFQSLMDKIRKIHGHALHGMEWLSEFGVWAASSFAGNLANLIPGWGYVQSAADIYAGTRTAVLKAKDFIGQMYSGYGVELMGGHPAIIANALARHSLGGMFSGLKDATVGIANIAIEAAGDAAGGAGTIVSAVTGVLQRIAQLVDYIIQNFRMKSVFNRAAKEWNNRGSKNSILHDHKAFSEWFQSTVISNPVVAALTMGSGFVAHPYRFLRLLYPDNHGAGYSEYAKGVHHIETLKKSSAKYVQEYADNYGVKFTSTDNLVAARLGELMTGKGILHGHEFAVTAP